MDIPPSRSEPLPPPPPPPPEGEGGRKKPGECHWLELFLSYSPSPFRGGGWGEGAKLPGVIVERKGFRSRPSSRHPPQDLHPALERSLVRRVTQPEVRVVPAEDLAWHQQQF